MNISRKFTSTLLIAFVALVLFTVIAILLKLFLFPWLPEALQNWVILCGATLLVTLAVLSGFASLTGYSLRDFSFHKKTSHKIHITFSSKYIEGCSKGELYELQIIVTNDGNQIINHYGLEFVFPDLAAPHILPLFKGPIGYIQIGSQTFANENGFYRVVYDSRVPLAIGNQFDVGKEIGFRYCCPNVAGLRGSEELVVTWNLQTDDGFSLNGKTNIFELGQSSQ